MPANPRNLRAKLRFEQRSTTTDAYGNEVGDWLAQFTTRGEIRPLRGGESVLAARLSGTQPVMITVYANQQTREITPDWRAVEIRGDGTERVYAIHTAEDMEQRNRQITILAEAGVAA